MLSLSFLCLTEGKKDDCTDYLKKKASIPEDGVVCKTKWKDLRDSMKPTQPEVGYAWIARKVEKDFKTKKGEWRDPDDISKELSDDPTPVVIARNFHDVSDDSLYFYLVDDHHSLCALDYSGLDDVVVSLKVLCDRRDVSPSDAAFWSVMSSHGLAYLGKMTSTGGLPQRVPFQALPSSFSFTKKDQSLADNPWRSLAGFSRKVVDEKCEGSKYCLRCMKRGCGKNGLDDSGPAVFFFEFRWGYFFQDVYLQDQDNEKDNYWPDDKTRLKFEGQFQKVKAAMDKILAKDKLKLDDVDLKDWANLAAYVVPLCRSEKTKDYELPAEVFAIATGNPLTLPGYVEGDVSLPDDPACASGQCPAHPYGRVIDEF